MKILIVDKDHQLLDTLAVGFRLQWSDVTVVQADESEVASRVFHDQRPDVVILDMDLAKNRSVDLLQEFRMTSDAWVIAVSAQEDEARQVATLDSGADAFVVKPFGPAVLMALIKAFMRRERLPLTGHISPDLVCGDLAVSFQRRRVTLRGQPVRLTPVEYRLLYYLIRNAGQTMAHQSLLHLIWGDKQGVSVVHLKVFISRLRAKIEPKDGPRFVETERGLGYRFVCLSSEATAVAGSGPE